MRTSHRIVVHTPFMTALGMIALFFTADHLHLSFLLGYLLSLLALSLAMTYHLFYTQAQSLQTGVWHRREVSIRALFAFWGGVCLASTVGYAEQREAFPSYDLERITHIEAILTEPSVVYTDLTRISLRMSAIHTIDSVLSARGRLHCLYREQQYIDTGSSVHAKVKLQIHESERAGAPPQCTITEIVALKEKDGAVGGVAALRRSILSNMRAALQRFPQSSVPLLHALFLGERASLNPTIGQRFRTAGLSHLLALSGMHLAIITLLSGLLLQTLLGVRGARIGGILFVLLYVWVVGNKPSLNRAAIMLIMWNVMLLIDRRITSLNILSYAFILLSCTYPRIRGDLSFQLSFSAVGGIIITSSPIRQRLQRILPTILAKPLALTIAAQIITLPLLIYHFGVWYPVGIMSSLAITPLITLFMWSAPLLLPLYALPSATVHAVIDKYTVLLYAIIQQGVYWFSKFPAYQF